MAIQIIIGAMSAIFMIAVGFGALTPIITFMYYEMIPQDNIAPEAQLSLDNTYQTVLASGVMLFGVVILWAIRSATKRDGG